MPDKNETVTVTMSRGAWEVTVYLLRRTAHREDPDEYNRPPYPPFYDGVRDRALAIRLR